MKDDLFDYLVATDNLDEFLGYKEPQDKNDDYDESFENDNLDDEEDE